MGQQEHNMTSSNHMKCMTFYLTILDFLRRDDFPEHSLHQFKDGYKIHFQRYSSEIDSGTASKVLLRRFSTYRSKLNPFLRALYVLVIQHVGPMGDLNQITRPKLRYHDNIATLKF